MSVDIHLVCHTCKEHVHVAHHGLSGFSFYAPNLKLKKFTELHTLERSHHAATMEFVTEHQLETYDYLEFECPG